MTQLMQRAIPTTTAAAEGRADRRRRNTFTWREVGVAAAATLAWGAFLWLVIGGAVELFGNPWTTQ